jgi:hypothetical protein
MFSLPNDFWHCSYPVENLSLEHKVQVESAQKSNRAEVLFGPRRGAFDLYFKLL